MPYPDNLLVRGERVIVNKRPHWKVLILPTIFFILIIGGGFALGAWWRNQSWASVANWIAVGVAVKLSMTGGTPSVVAVSIADGSETFVAASTARPRY